MKIKIIKTSYDKVAALKKLFARNQKTEYTVPNINKDTVNSCLVVHSF